MTIVTSKSFSIQDARTEGAVLQCMKDWGTAHPAELVAFKEQMAQKRHGLINKEGYTKLRNMRSVAEIPVTLNNMITRRFGPLWVRDKRLMHLVVENFKIGQVWVGHARMSNV